MNINVTELPSWKIYTTSLLRIKNLSGLSQSITTTTIINLLMPKC
jgi:hypothetical protein